MRSFYKYSPFVILHRRINNVFSLKLFEINRFQHDKHFNPLRKRYHPYDFIEIDSKIATRICLTILGNGAVGQPRCLGLFTDFKSYFFNCGEGVSRLCREYEVNMCQIKHVFITQKKWENLSGLPDIYLTGNAYGVKKMTIHGPPGVEHFLSLISSTDLDLRLSKKSSKHVSYSDETLKVEYVPIKSINTMYNSKNTTKKSKTYVTGEPDVSFSYICQIFEKPGEFLAEKCVEHGVPIGPDLLKLKNGQDVILPSGKTVRSSDVCDPPMPGTTFLVVDCPSEPYLDSFVSEEKLHKCHLPSDTSLNVSSVFHFSPSHIINSRKYQDWINRFHQDTHHFILNDDNPTTSSHAVHQTHSAFHFLHPKIFSLLQEKKEASPQYLNVPGTVIQPPPMLQLHIRPYQELSWDNVVVNHQFEDYMETIKSLPEFCDLTKNLEYAKNNSHLKDKNEEYPEVLFLGTGSSTSTAFRNVSAILINTSPNSCILLDCGEGSFMQLVRHYGPSNVGSVLRKLTCIFISHKHTDHYMGLFELMRHRLEAFKAADIPYEPLVLILPNVIEDILKRYCEIFEPILSGIRIFNCSYLKYGNGKSLNLRQFLGNIQVETVPVKHCENAYGVVIQQNSEWKIVYSGDTAPCQRLIDAGKNCTLLIHEASIEDDLVNEASLKMHSTPSQVIEISDKMNAQYTIMTHFSKRYLGIPVVQEYNHRHMGCAYDFMKVHFSDLHLLPLFLPALKYLFQEQFTANLERTASVVSFENVFVKNLKSLL